MPSSGPDTEVPKGDVALYKQLGELGEEVVGYPCRSVYETYPAIDDRGTRSAAGGFIEWTWDGLGIFGFAPELWDIEGRAGIEGRWQGPWYTKDETEEEGLKILKWLDENLRRRASSAGGPSTTRSSARSRSAAGTPRRCARTRRPKFLEAECAKVHRFVLRQAAVSAAVRVGQGRDRDARRRPAHRPRDDRERRLPADELSQKAINLGVAKAITVELGGEGAEILLGEPKQTIGHLEGRAQAVGMMFDRGGPPPQRGARRVARAVARHGHDHRQVGEGRDVEQEAVLG